MNSIVPKELTEYEQFLEFCGGNPPNAEQNPKQYEFRVKTFLWIKEKANGKTK